jgi:hypothetical protein
MDTLLRSPHGARMKQVANVGFVTAIAFVLLGSNVTFSQTMGQESLGSPEDQLEPYPIVTPFMRPENDPKPLTPNPYLDRVPDYSPNKPLRDSLSSIDADYRGVDHCSPEVFCRSLKRVQAEGQTVGTVAFDYVCSELSSLPPDFDVIFHGSAGPVELRDGSLRDFCRSYSH